MRVAVIIVAAGQGARIGGSVPKQLIDLGGRSMLQRSVAAFDAHPDVHEIIVVLPEALVESGKNLVGDVACRTSIVAGGKRRQDSVANGFASIGEQTEVVLVHDAARPFANRALIDRVIAATAETGAVVPAVPARDTVKRVSRSRDVTATIPRDEVWLAQTPQGFRRAILADAIARGADNVEATDEAMLAELAGHTVRVVDGDVDNVKITEPQDVVAARARLGAVETFRVGTGYDLHRLVAGRPLVLAGVVIPFERGPLGHSDGDVVCHALVDAIFGAAAEGDIGRHFPNNDPAWKDAAGLDLLSRGVAIVRAKGWAIANADVTVLLEQPKLAPVIQQIRERLAPVLGVALSAVSVKGKTNEGMDAVGRGEAIAAHASVLLTSASAPGSGT